MLSTQYYALKLYSLYIIFFHNYGSSKPDGIK